MASPQLEDGYTRVANEIMERLSQISLPAYEFRAVFCLLRLTYGFGKRQDWITLNQFSRAMKVDRRNVHRALRSLMAKQIVVVSRDDKNRPFYNFQKDYEQWNLSSAQTTNLSSPQMTIEEPECVSSDDKSVSPQMTNEGVECVSTDDKMSSPQTTNQASKQESKDERVCLYRRQNVVSSDDKGVSPQTPSKERRRVRAKALTRKDTRVKEFIDWFSDEYSRTFNEKYHVIGGKDGTVVQHLLRDYSLDRLKDLGKSFLESRDEWTVNAGYTIGVFKSQINKLVTRGRVHAARTKPGNAAHGRGPEHGGVQARPGKYDRFEPNR